MFVRFAAWSDVNALEYCYNLATFHYFQTIFVCFVFVIESALFLKISALKNDLSCPSASYIITSETVVMLQNISGESEIYNGCSWKCQSW